MPQQYHNPFAGINLVYPLEQRGDYERFCQPGSDIDHSPFPRMVDLWFTGLAIAAREGRKAVDLSGRETSNFITGAIFDRDSWRVQVVMLVAITVEGGVEVVGDANRMMTIANGLAAAGVPRIVEMLEGAEAEAIWNLSEAVYSVLSEES